MSRFLSVLEKSDYKNCAFHFDSVRKSFSRLGVIESLPFYLTQWLKLLLCALRESKYRNSYEHNRSLFRIALYLNDKHLAKEVLQVYLNGFDLDIAFPEILNPPSNTPHMLNKDVKIQNRIDNKPRVLIHVDGDMAFHLSEGTGKVCAEAMLDLLLEYGYPATVSFVCEDIIYYKIEKKNKSIEQKLIAKLHSPNITLASHGFIHPYSWQREKFNLTREIWVAKKFLEDWAKKEIPILLYTGDCTLSSEQLWEVEKCGMLGVNGKARFKLPIIKYVNSWFQFLAAGVSDYSTKNYAKYNIKKFEMIKRKKLDYPIHIYVHYYIMLTKKRRSELVKVFEWLKENSQYLYFDTLQSYYGELRKQLLYPELK
jgi:hypothetical protein